MALLNIGGEKWLCVVPWHNSEQKKWFAAMWGDTRNVLFVQDKLKQGCAVTKNRGIALAMKLGADCVAVLDDDCGPVVGVSTIPEFLSRHAECLAGANLELFKQVTTPQSRGTPYKTRAALMPVAASMGFWDGVGDLDALLQLSLGATKMQCDSQPVFGQYFPLCGMNLAFRPRDWLPWCQFIDVPRFDDIWMGFLWQKEAYRRGHCFNLNGPRVYHSRQSNVWANLRDETKHLEINETLWLDIAQAQETSYSALRNIITRRAGV